MIAEAGSTKAERVIKFIEERCTHTKGKWAGRPFILLPWQKDIIRRLYGTLKPNGLRQYRICYLEIPKKNGKTELLAALALYHLYADYEPGAEVYSAAADRDQAGLCYLVAAQMVRQNPKLSRRLEVIDSKKRIVDFETASFYQVLSAEVPTKHGLNPSCVLFDELHAQQTDELWRVLTSGTDYAREQQVVMCTSTAGVYDKESVWWKVREKARQVRDGLIHDPSFLPILYIADPDEDDPADEALWQRVNPSIGHIFTLDKIRQDFQTVQDDPVEYNDFLRFRLNIPVSSVSRWISQKKWDACGAEIDLDALKGKSCYGGLDLSSEWDITSYVLVFPPQEGVSLYTVVCRFYVPEENMQERVRKDKVRYDIWVKEGWITATPGNVVDYRFILHDISADAETYDLREIAFDRWGAAKVIQDLQEMGFEDEKDEHAQRHLVKFGQGFSSMSRPTKELRKLIQGGEISHGNNPVLNWMSGNMVVQMDAAGNLKPDKSKSTEKIDGMVALIMGLDRATLTHEVESIYEEQEVLLI